MVDIESAMTTTEALTTAKANYETREGPYTQAYSKYPLIYGEEALRKINGEPSTGKATGIGMSDEATTGLDANGFIPRVNGARNTVEDAKIEPANTYYYLNDENFAAALGYPASGYTGTNGPFLPIQSSTRSYWVASRCVYATGSHCDFDVRSVSGGSLSSSNMFVSNGGLLGGPLGLFPIVTLSAGSLVETETSGVFEYNVAE